MLARDGQQGLEAVQNHTVDAAVVDIFMPNMDGLELIAAVHKARSDIPVLAISGGGTFHVDFLGMAAKLGARYTLHKPFRLRDFLVILEKMLNTENVT